MRRALQESRHDVQSRKLRPDFEEHFEKTWLRDMVKAGVKHIAKTAEVGDYGAKEMFWSAVGRALADHLHARAHDAYDFDRNLSPQEKADLGKDPGIPF